MIERHGPDVIVHPPAAIMRMGGDPLGLGGLRVAPHPQGADLDLTDIVAMQSAYIAELRAKIEMRETGNATLALALQALVWYAEQGRIPPRNRQGKIVADHRLVEQLRGSTVSIGSTVDGDLIVAPLQRAVNPRWDDDTGGA